MAPSPDEAERLMQNQQVIRAVERLAEKAKLAARAIELEQARHEEQMDKLHEQNFQLHNEAKHVLAFVRGELPDELITAVRDEESK